MVSIFIKFPGRLLHPEALNRLLALAGKKKYLDRKRTASCPGASSLYYRQSHPHNSNRIFPLQAYLAQTGSSCVIPGSRHLVSHPLAWLLFTCMAALFTFLTRIFKQDLSLPTWQHRDMLSWT